MPLYPYRCKQCDYRFEKIQRFSAKPEKKCPKCGGELERLLAAPGLQFKGSGWYVTDYAKGHSSAGVSSNETMTSSEPKPSPAEKAKPAEKSGSAAPSSSTPASAPGSAKS